MTIERIEARHGGIVLFHDIKPQTVAALPIVLSGLKERGYKIVHLRAKRAYQPLESHAAALRPLLGKAHGNGTDSSIATLEGLGDDGGAAEATPHAKVNRDKSREPATKASVAGPRRATGTTAPAPSPPGDSDWATTVQRGRTVPGTH
jgi:hypothetical protein